MRPKMVTAILHRQVKFRIQSIYMPEPADILQELYGNAELTGEVVDFSDSGTQNDHYAIIEVAGLHRPILVPVDALAKP